MYGANSRKDESGTSATAAPTTLEDGDESEISAAKGRISLAP